jgi:hypothetical protein
MITLTQPTPNLLPSFNRILYKIVSDNADETGFKYVVKVYNTDDELMATAYYDSPANPSEEVEFDVSKFVSTYYDLNVGYYQSTNAVNTDDIIQGFYLKCYEYRDVNGVYAIILDTEVVSTTKYAYAGAFPLLELKNWYANYQQYTGVSNTTYKPFTDWTSIKCRLTDSQIIPFYNDGKIVSMSLLVTYTGGTTSTFTITPSATATPKVTYFRINPIAYGGTTESIRMTINWNNGSARSMIVGYIYIQGCGKFEPIRVAYLNKYGGYDFFNFDLANRSTSNIERKQYKKDYTGDIYEADGIRVKNTNPIYYTKETQNWKIVSDYLTDAQSVLIRELYTSPSVYINLVNDTYITPSWIPVKLVPNSYELKQTITDKLFNLELDVEFGLVNTRQSV